MSSIRYLGCRRIPSQGGWAQDFAGWQVMEILVFRLRCDLLSLTWLWNMAILLMSPILPIIIITYSDVPWFSHRYLRWPYRVSGWELGCLWQNHTVYQGPWHHDLNWASGPLTCISDVDENCKGPHGINIVGSSKYKTSLYICSTANWTYIDFCSTSGWISPHSPALFSSRVADHPPEMMVDEPAGRDPEFYSKGLNECKENASRWWPSCGIWKYVFQRNLYHENTYTNKHKS